MTLQDNCSYRKYSREETRKLLQPFSIKKVPGIYYACREENQATKKTLIHIKTVRTAAEN